MCWTQISPRKQIAESNRLECKSLVNWCGVHPQMCDPIETPWWQKINSKSVRRGKKRSRRRGHWPNVVFHPLESKFLSNTCTYLPTERTGGFSRDAFEECRREPTDTKFNLREGSRVCSIASCYYLVYFTRSGNNNGLIWMRGWSLRKQQSTQQFLSF